MIKKMMLLAGMALAAIALAVPASASAFEWTHEGEPFEGTVEDTLSGRFAIGAGSPGSPRFDCAVHIGLQVSGGSSTGTITGFSPTTETCEGEGWYAGCELVEDKTTLPADTTVHIVGTNEATLTTPAGEPMAVNYVLDAGCFVEKVTWTVGQLALGGTGSDLTDVTITGAALMHTTFRGVGEMTHNMALAGTVGTETDTITIS